MAVLSVVPCALYGWLVVWPAAQSTTNGFAAYYTAAHILRHEPEAMGHVYNNAWFAARMDQAGIIGVYDIFNVQPPTMSLLLLPLAWMGPPTARLTWVALSFLLLPAGLLLLAGALGARTRWALWALPVSLLYAPVTENLQNGQAYLLLFFLLSVFLWALSSDREPIGGVALGLMLVLKTAGVWLWPLLLWERRWRVLAWGALVAGALALATLPWIGADAWAAYGRQLPQLAVAPERAVTAYQTVTSLVGHLFVRHPRWNPAPVIDCALLAQGVTAFLLVGTLALSTLWVRVDASSDGGSRHPAEKEMLSLALFSALLAPNAPVAEGYHYILVLPSLLVGLWHVQHQARDWRAWLVPLLAALLIGAPLPYTSRRLQGGWLALVAYPRVYGAYLLWAWLGWRLATLRGRCPRRLSADQRLTTGDGL